MHFGGFARFLPLGWNLLLYLGGPRGFLPLRRIELSWVVLDLSASCLYGRMNCCCVWGVRRIVLLLRLAGFDRVLPFQWIELLLYLSGPNGFLPLRCNELVWPLLRWIELLLYLGGPNGFLPLGALKWFGLCRISKIPVFTVE